jgi:pyruvate ferredoxin oxidoreductase gamma subunit
MVEGNKEFRIHGRGGQGAKSAAQLLAEAAILQGKYVQAFPEYGPERSGAPVASFVRISRTRITTHQPVVSPDYVGVIDESMLTFSLIQEGLKKDSLLIVNSSMAEEELKKRIGYKGKIYCVPATQIAMKHLGMNKTNTVILAALAFFSKSATLNDLKKVTYDLFKTKSESIADSNLKIIKEVWNMLKKR